MKHYFLVFLAIISLVGIVSADSATIYTTYDGYMTRSGGGAAGVAWATLRNNTAASSIDSAAQTAIISLTSGTTENYYNALRRGFYSFNTSIVGSTSTVNSANISIYSTGTIVTTLSDYTIGVTKAEPADPTSWVVGDWDTGDDDLELLSTRGTSAEFDTVGYHTYNFNSDGVASINKAGYSSYLIRSNWDIDYTPPTWSSAASLSAATYTVETTGSNENKLSIDWTPAAGGDTTPPPSISNLANTTTCNSINWTWTNPGGDQNETVIWKDGVLLKNVTNITTFDLWESLSEYTEYTFSSKTKDIAENLNATFVNQTARTLGDPIAAFSCTPLTGAVPLSVTCTDASTRAPTTWVWYNNTTQVSTSQSPTFNIDTIGDQDLSLNASNTCGFDWENKTDYITTSASGCGLICKIVLYIRQFHLPYQMVRL